MSIRITIPLNVFEQNNSLPFGFPSWNTYKHRTTALLINAPKFFFAAFTWEAFGLLATDSLNLSDESAGYYFMTGLGTTIGVVVVSLLLINMTHKPDYDAKEQRNQYHNAALVAIAAGVVAGTLWQVSVNISVWNDFSFTQAFFFVYMMSTLAYFITVTICRIVNAHLPESIRLSWSIVGRRVSWLDFLLALAVAAADAFFVGTDDADFRNGWLLKFQCTEGTAPFMAMLLSGSSGLCGYLIFQFILNATVKDECSWLDEATEDSNNDTTSSNNSKHADQIFDVQNPFSSALANEQI